MSEIFNVEKIKYEGPKSKNPLAFKYYDADRVIMGKKMSEHLPFAMAWWHNLCAEGTDMFGRGVANKSFGTEYGTMEHAKKKVDAGFEFMQSFFISKLEITVMLSCYCQHGKIRIVIFIGSVITMNCHCLYEKVFVCHTINHDHRLNFFHHCQCLFRTFLIKLISIFLANLFNISWY